MDACLVSILEDLYVHHQSVVDPLRILSGLVICRCYLEISESWNNPLSPNTIKMILSVLSVSYDENDKCQEYETVKNYLPDAK